MIRRLSIAHLPAVGLLLIGSLDAAVAGRLRDDEHSSEDQLETEAVDVVEHGQRHNASLQRLRRRWDSAPIEIPDKGYLHLDTMSDDAHSFRTLYNIMQDREKDDGYLAAVDATYSADPSSPLQQAKKIAQIALNGAEQQANSRGYGINGKPMTFLPGMQASNVLGGATSDPMYDSLMSTFSQAGSGGDWDAEDDAESDSLW
eukprot:TRINITY_DN31511_c0_g1_i1.p1 TRINITY_DN31511_c0_g1~~TRINITY_DN31511_c0_g1_i1.p1  ORF type:complete len:202 (+),score=52.13 TRINITY_DN31511_c0_g1_i1:73-678(+)